MIKKILTILSNIVSPGYWAELIGDKLGLWDLALNNRFRHYVLNLTGWKYWFYQIVVCGIVFIILEFILNKLGLTLLPF